MPLDNAGRTNIPVSICTGENHGSSTGTIHCTPFRMASSSHGLSIGNGPEPKNGRLFAVWAADRPGGTVSMEITGVVVRNWFQTRRLQRTDRPKAEPKRQWILRNVPIMDTSGETLFHPYRAGNRAICAKSSRYDPIALTGVPSIVP